MKKKNPQDITLRNLRALNKRIAALKKKDAILELLIAGLDERLKVLEKRRTRK